MQTFIPQTDPRADYLDHQYEIDAAIQGVLEGGRYILGRECDAFECEFADYLGLRTSIGVANGTDALTLALMACGIGPGDAVITVSHTAVATVAAIERCGALPILIDIEPDSYTMDPECFERAVRDAGKSSGPRVRAVVVVHLYGGSADMAAILDIARRFDLRIIEDCAQAHGAMLAGRRLGSWGDIATFSFYPTKNLSAIGDGGAVATNDAELAERVRLIRQYGWKERYVSDIPGFNSRLDELQASILRIKLRYLDQANTRRRLIADLYDAELVDSGLALPWRRSGADHIFHQYVIRANDRAALQEWLQQADVGTLVHYPVPVHRQPAYRNRLHLPRELPHTDQASEQVLSLPMYAQLPQADAKRVVARLREWISQH